MSTAGTKVVAGNCRLVNASVPRSAFVWSNTFVPFSQTRMMPSCRPDADDGVKSTVHCCTCALSVNGSGDIVFEFQLLLSIEKIVYPGRHAK